MRLTEVFSIPDLFFPVLHCLSHFIWLKLIFCHWLILRHIPSYSKILRSHLLDSFHLGFLVSFLAFLCVESLFASRWIWGSVGSKCEMSFPQVLFCLLVLSRRKVSFSMLRSWYKSLGRCRFSKELIRIPYSITMLSLPILKLVFLIYSANFWLSSYDEAI